MLLVGTLVGLAQVKGFLPTPVDAWNYWRAGTSVDLYPDRWGDPGVGQWLFYPPFVAQISRLMQPIGWDLFVFVIAVSTFLAMWYCLRRWSVLVLALGTVGAIAPLPPVTATLLGYALIGNLQWILAATILLAIRHPTLWVVELLTKVTPSIGWWWHVIRGEWGSAARGALVAGAVLAVSVVASPDMWRQFFVFTEANGSMAEPPMPMFPVPFGIRLITAAILLGWGARTDRRWTVPIAAGWALPAIWGLGFLPFWAAATRLVEVPAMPQASFRRIRPASAAAGASRIEPTELERVRVAIG